MAKVIVVATQKGGIGKTQTSVNLVAWLNQCGKKALLIDADSSFNSTMTFSVAGQSRMTLYNVLMGEVPIKDAIVHTEYGDILPSSGNLDTAVNMLSATNDHFRLADVLEAVRDVYDYIVIDTHPSIDTLLYNCLVASDYIIIPVSAGSYSESGLITLYKCVARIQKRSNPTLKIAGLLHVLFEARVNVDKEANKTFAELADRIGTRLFTTIIRKDAKVKESVDRLIPLMYYRPKTRAAIDYKNFTAELLEIVASDEEAKSEEEK